MRLSLPFGDCVSRLWSVMTNVETERNDADKVQTRSFLSRLRKWIVGIAVDNATKLVIIPLAAALLWGGWVIVDGHIRSYLATIFSQELAKEKSELLEAFKST